jgi:pyruvate formate lyase activating enzyme
MTIDREACDACGLCQNACPAGALEVIGKEYSVRETLDEVERDEVFYRNSGGGVTVSGGEPALQPGFVKELLMSCSEAGLHVALDTCGYAPPGVLKEIVELSDMVLLDLKMMDEPRHLELAGVGLQTILDNARMISATGKPMWIRTPIIPGYTDSEDNISALSRFISEELTSVERYDLLAFNNTCGAKYRRLDLEWGLDGMPLLTSEAMEALASIARESGLDNVSWSGATRRDG